MKTKQGDTETTRQGNRKAADWAGRRTCFALLVSLSPCLLACSAGCQQQMADQPRYDPLEPSRFFADGLSARHPVSGTVARGQLRDDLLYFTGRVVPKQPADPSAEKGGAEILARLGPSLERADVYTQEFPFPLTLADLRRGQERFGIYCAVCHDPQGTGAGTIIERGYTRPPSLHADRLRQAPAGYFFDVITRGYGAMPPYATQVPPADRWAIVAYVRVLQLSQHAELGQLPEAVRQRFSEGGVP